MSDLFALRHCFIVFHPGAAGNFLAGLTNKLVSNELSNLDISLTGSSHSPNNKSKLSCNIFTQPASLPEHRLTKISQYRKYFSQLDIKNPTVNWTHDFTNIPVYQQLFPNAKILVVTQESINEKLTVTIQQQLKNILDPNVNSAIPEARLKVVLDRWREYAENKITELVGNKELANTIVDDRFNPKYKDIVTYVTLVRMLEYYKLLGNDPDVVNCVLLPTVGHHVFYRQLLTSVC